MQTQRPSSFRGRPGLTLIELIVVLVILASIAALVIPRLGFIKEQADMPTSASGVSDVASNLETYRVTSGSYPLGMDSLLNDDGSAVYSKIWTHTAGPSTFGLGTELTDGTIPPGSGGQFNVSFGHTFAPPSTGYYLYDHAEASTDPSNSATLRRTFASASNAKVATVTGANLIKAAGYPTGLPTDGSVMLIAFGVGPNSASVGQTMAGAPRHASQEPEFYGRYIGIFAVYKNGKGAELKTVVDSFGNMSDANVSSFKNNAPSGN